MSEIIGLFACIGFSIIALFSELYIFIWIKEKEGGEFPLSTVDFMMRVKYIFAICVLLAFCFYKLFSFLLLHSSI